MNNILKLVKLQIDEKYNFLKTADVVKMLASIGKYFTVVLVLTVVFWYTIARLSTVGIVINAGSMAVFLFVIQVISFCFSIGSIFTNLYFNRGNELLLAMPVSHNQIFISKILTIYIQELVISSIYTLPLLFALAWSSQAFNLTAYYSMLPVLVLLLPILPLALAALVAVPVMYLVKLLKRFERTSIILMFTAVACGFVLYITLLHSVVNVFADIANNQFVQLNKINMWLQSVGKKLVPYIGIATALERPLHFWWLIIYLCVGFAILCVGIAINKYQFLKAATDSIEREKQTSAKEKKYAVASPFKVLLIYEFREMFRSPSNLFKYFLFTVMMPVIAISTDILLSQTTLNIGGQTMLTGAHILVWLICAMLSNIFSATAISKEGANFYVIKTSPINYYIQSLAKVMFNVIFTVSAIVLTAILSAFYLPISQIVFAAIIILLFSLGHLLWCFDMDLRAPVLNWTDPDDATGNITGAIIKGLLMSLLVGGFIMISAFKLNLGVIFAVLVIFGTVFLLYRIYILILRINYRFTTIDP
jgi:hypothetical protein